MASIKSGVQILRISACNEASCIWSPSLTGSVALYSLGELRSPWKPRFVSKRSTRHFRRRDPRFLTTTTDCSLPVWILLAAPTHQEFPSLRPPPDTLCTRFSSNDSRHHP